MPLSPRRAPGRGFLRSSFAERMAWNFGRRGGIWKAKAKLEVIRWFGSEHELNRYGSSLDVAKPHSPGLLSYMLFFQLTLDGVKTSLRED